MTDKEQNRTDGRWLRRWWISGSPQCVVVYRWLVEKVVGQWQSTVCCGVQVVGREGGGSAAVHSVLWCTGGWSRRWWVSGSPQCVVVYRWLVEKVVGQ